MTACLEKLIGRGKGTTKLVDVVPRNQAVGGYEEMLSCGGKRSVSLRRHVCGKPRSGMNSPSASHVRPAMEMDGSCVRKSCQQATSDTCAQTTTHSIARIVSS